MNYIIDQEDIKIKEVRIPKGSKYTLNSKGYLHSFNDLPAIIDPNGYQEWWLNGELHREDGPAIIHSDGTQSWCFNGKLHRSDGPAIIHPDGYQAWFLNGKLHRSDGPAVIHSDGPQYWYLNGEEVKPIEVLKLLKAKGVDIIHFTLSNDKRIREAVKQLL